MSFFTRRFYRLTLLLVVFFAVGTFAQDLPTLAVYVSGAQTPAVNKAMANGLISALANSGHYQAADNYKDFFDQVAEEQKGGAVSMNAEQVKKLGQRFDMQYICIAEIVTVLDENQISTQVVNVETGKVVAIGVAESSLKTLADITDVSERIVSKMIKNVPPPSPPQQVKQTLPAATSAIGVDMQKSTAQPQQVQSKMSLPQQVQPKASQPQQAYSQQSSPRQKQGYYRRNHSQQNYSQSQDVQVVTNNNIINKVDYKQQPVYQDFTTAERLGTWVINDIIPGMGSFIIMGDAKGGVAQLLLGVGGYICIFNGFSEEYNYYNGIRYQVGVKPNAALYIGVGALTSCVICNVARSVTYKKKLPAQYGITEDSSLKMAVLPDKYGDIKAYLAYDVKF
ncbi:MAG: hypothetical protein LBC59_03455 [Chitinispirillales bacterium]|jgi:hypothetical protein|nr:hypothetical protein [Chitinispirillales bacterium]